MIIRSACCFGAVFALSVSAFAQGGRPVNPNPTPTNPGTSVPGPGRNTSPFPTTNPNTNNPNTMGMDRPIFLSGKVVLDDGTAPSEPVAIQRTCMTTPRTGANTDSKGHSRLQS